MEEEQITTNGVKSEKVEGKKKRSRREVEEICLLQQCALRSV